MKSLQQWRTKKMFMEFVGPQGQPDPTSQSAPVLPPGMTNGPAEPMMGTQPGMSMESPKGSHLRQIYDDFMNKLKKKSADDLAKIKDQFNSDIDELTSQQGGSTQNQQDDMGFSPLGNQPQ